MKKLRIRPFPGQLTTEVTPRETEHRALARIAADESIALLENKGNVLPLAQGSKLALYGGGAVKTIKGGTGSGDVNERDCVNIRSGLENAGFELTTGEWLDSYERIYDSARKAWHDDIVERGKDPENKKSFIFIYFETPFVVPGGEPIDIAKAAADGADTAVYVISRVAGEGRDRFENKGDYYLSDSEEAELKSVCAAYRHVVLVINSGSVIDMKFTKQYDNIDAVIMMAQAGQEGGNALADVLTGKVNPSGKLTDTWAENYSDYPSYDTFSYKSGDVYKEEYFEGIYVGYRYFDTFGVPVRYSFGHGLSYTTFETAVTGIKADAKRVSVSVKVTNTGSVAGKEVAQIYVSCPQGRLTKEFRRLAGFAKTKLLAAGEAQELTVSFPLYQLASYEEAGAQYILEGGRYGVWAGNSLANAKLAGSVVLDADAVLVKCTNICPLQQELKEIAPDADKLSAKSAAWLAEAEKLPAVAITAAEIPCEEISYEPQSAEFHDEAGELVNRMDTDTLVHYATGEPALGQESALGAAGQTVPGAAAETTWIGACEPMNLASMVLADGPAGIRLSRTYEVLGDHTVPQDFSVNFEGGLFAEATGDTEGAYRKYQYCTAIPVGVLLAQSWDMELIRKVGEMIGSEMNLFEVTLWLAPGMNIHRNPLCGRNFEYYSEDPLMAGLCAGAMTRGVQSVPGCGTTVKHYACNSQEDNRMGSDSVLSERALREIYLKGFEIAVKDAQPMSIMTSYNLINGVHAANCYDTCTKAARNEWGFAGAIMTDWTTTTASTAGECTASGCMRAGNDMVMPGSPKDHENIHAELKDGSLSLDELKVCVHNTVKLVLASNQYEDAESYGEKFEGLGTYMTAE